MQYLRKRYLTWWEKYTYVLSSAILSGIAFSGIIIFFAVQYHDKSIDWWGNNVPYAGLDNPYSASLDPAVSAPDGYFGPRVGNFP